MVCDLKLWEFFMVLCIGLCLACDLSEISSEPCCGGFL